MPLGWQVPTLTDFFVRRLRVANIVARSDTLFTSMDQRHLGTTLTRINAVLTRIDAVLTRNHAILTRIHVGPYHEMEYAVALGDARAVMVDLREYIERSVGQGFFVNIPVHLRLALFL